MSQCGSWEREKLPSGGNPLEELCVCGVSEGQQWGQGRHEGEISPSLSREEESKPTQRESSLCKQPSHTWANPQNWDKVSKRWEIHPPAAFSSVSSAGQALMCWLHYFPTSPCWMADLWRERCTITPSFPGHKDRERSWDHAPSHRPGVCPGNRGDPLNLHRCEKWRAVTGQQRWSQLASDRIHSFCLSGNWFQTTNPPTSHRWKDRDGRSFCVFDSTLKPQHLTRLLFKINIHLDTNRPYGFSKYTSHIIQPHEFPKCQTANLHFLG